MWQNLDFGCFGDISVRGRLGKWLRVTLRLSQSLNQSKKGPDKSRSNHDDGPFIVLTETKFSFRCIPVGIGTLLTGLGSKKKHM